MLRRHEEWGANQKHELSQLTKIEIQETKVKCAAQLAGIFCTRQAIAVRNATLGMKSRLKTKGECDMGVKVNILAALKGLVINMLLGLFI